MPKQILAAIAFASFGACANLPESDLPSQTAIAEADTLAIQSVLDTQQTAWNAGDIDGFMQGYWQSPKLRFASGGNITYGWQETLSRYKSNYSDRAKMGTLDFTDLEVSLVSSDAAILHGRWKLTRERDAPHGLFTLILRKKAGEWLIVSDTTTSGGS